MTLENLFSLVEYMHGNEVSRRGTTLVVEGLFPCVKGYYGTQYVKPRLNEELNKRAKRLDRKEKI